MPEKVIKAVVTTVSNWMPSQYSDGGMYKKVIFKDLEDGKNYILYIYDKIQKTMYFDEVVKPGVCLENLTIKGEKFINGFSEFKVMPKEHEKAK